MQAGELFFGPVIRRNLATNPGFERFREADFAPYQPGTDTGLVMASGGSAVLTSSTEWTASGSRSLKIAPGGTESAAYPWGTAGGALNRMGLTLGRTYTLAATLRLPAVQAGTLSALARQIAVGVVVGGVTDWSYTVSAKAANTVGTTRLVATFTAPENAESVFVRLMNGSSNTPVYWDELMLEEGATSGAYFSGAWADTAQYSYRWDGAAHASTSSMYEPANPSTHVAQYSSRVLVNGVERPVLSWSLDRDLVGDLPEQVVAGGGVVQATGQIAWASTDDVTDGALNPWNPSTGWVPAEGDTVRILAGDGDQQWSQFVGVIDSTSGDIGGGITSKIIDRYDDLSKTVNIPALVNTMPPLESSGDWRRIGLSNLHHINTALRSCGFYTTPPRSANTVLDVPMQGTMWPIVGDVVTCHRLSTVQYPPIGEYAPWGASRSDAFAVFEPSVPRTGTTVVQLTLMRTTAHAGIAYARCTYGSANVELRLTATQAQARVNGATVATIGFTGDGAAQLLLKSGQVTIAASNGASNTATASLGSSALMDSIVLSADGNSRVAGLMVSHPPTAGNELNAINFNPSARIDAGRMHSGSIALPSVSETSAADLLDNLSRILLRPFWIDELGVLQCVGSDVLRDKAPVQTVTTLDDIRELSWSKNLLGVRSEVRARYLWPSITARRTHSVTVHEGSTEVLASGESLQTIVETPAGEDWVMTDDTPLVAGLGAFDDINKGVGSLIGGIYTDGVNEVWASMPGVDRLSMSMQQVGASKWAITATATTLEPGKQVELRTVSPEAALATSLWPAWWGHGLGIIRAKAKISWTERSRTPSLAGTRGPAYEHDFGAWATGDDIEGTGMIDEITSFIAEQVFSPAATIDSMRVGYDPRRQLGDVITVVSPTFMGVTMNCLIVGISTQAESGMYTQHLAVRIISVTTTFTSYQEFMDAWGTVADYDNFMTAWGAIATYADLTSDPLEGAANND